MTINAAMQDALDRIAARAQDVQRAYTPGALAQFGDVASEHASSRPALNPLSVAPPLDAYFLSTDARGRTVYTRDGCFRIANGTLVGSDGAPVLGRVSRSGANTALRIDPVDDALGRASDVRVERDGTLAYDRVVVDPRSGVRERERVAVGQLALARFPAATKLVAVDADHYLPPPGTVPHVGSAGDGNFAGLEPMRQTGSGIDFDRSLERLEEAYLAFDALQSAHRAQGELGKTAMDLLK